MDALSHWDMYEMFEGAQVIAYAGHGQLRRLSHIGADEATEILLQLGHLSTDFVRWYDQAKLGLADEEAKEAVRQILRDEIPTSGQTHQDLRVADLLAFGVPLDRILNTPATSTTQWVLEQAQCLTRHPQEHHDLKVMVTLRMFGELLVSETYRPVVDNMERWFGVPPTRSVFYEPHFNHDRLDGGDHALCFERVLRRLITSHGLARIAMDAARAAWELKIRLLHQFASRA